MRPFPSGRVFAIRRLPARFTVPLGMGLVSVLSTQLPPAPVIAVFGVAVALLRGRPLLNPGMRRLEDRAYLDGRVRARRGEGELAP